MEFTSEDKKRAIKTFSRFNLSVTAYSLVGVAIIYIFQFVSLALFGYDRLIELSESPYYTFGLQVAAMYLIAFPLFLLMIRKLPSRECPKSEMSLKEFGCIFLVCEAIMMLGSLFSNWLTTIIEGIIGHEIPNTTSDVISASPIWLIILVVVIIGPIIEEMIFRKAMIDKLSFYGDRLAIIVSAFAFGLFHGNLYQLFYATALGLVLGYIYVRTRNSMYNCIMHIIINFMGTIPSLLAQDSMDRLLALPEDAVIDGSMLSDYYIVLGVSGLQYTLAIAGIIVFWIATSRKAYSISQSCDIYIPTKDLARVVVLNAGSILFLVYHIAECISSILIT